MLGSLADPRQQPMCVAGKHPRPHIVYIYAYIINIYNIYIPAGTRDWVQGVAALLA